MKTTLLLLAASILLTSPAHAQATVTPQAGQLRKAGDMQVTLTALASSAETIEASFLVQNMGAVGVTLKPLAQISAKNSAGSALDAKDFLATGYRNGEVFLAQAGKKAGRMQFKIAGSGPFVIAYQATPTAEALTWKVELPAATQPAASVVAEPTRAPAAAPAAAADAKVYRIGDQGPAGGTIFYDKGSVSDGWRYLEAAPSDTSEGATWSAGGNVDVKTSPELGTGKANTAAIVAAQGNGAYAAKLCQDLKTGNVSDWFLPSKEELNLLYNALGKAKLGGFSFPPYAKKDYWTSSHMNGHLTFIQAFGDGTQTYQARANKLRVRAIRAF